MVLRKRRSAVRHGFTLMEILVVVAILVVLAGTGGVYYMKYLDDAKKDVARTQVRTALTQAADAYYIKYGDYPQSLQSLTQPTPDGGKASLEPSALRDPWGREYQYAYPGQHHTSTGKPDIWSTGPRPGDPNGMIGNWDATQGAGGQ